MNFGITFVKGDIELPSLNEDGTIRYSENQMHTYRDWGLIPASRPVVELPEVKTTYVECEAMDGGGIDVSEALTGYPLYKNRTFEQKFYRQGKDNWPYAFDKIFNWLHGRKIKMILDDDPSHFYIGRISIKEPKSDQYWSEITISADLGPFKYYVYKSDDGIQLNFDGETTQENNIIWDLIDFENGYSYYANAVFSGPFDGSAAYKVSSGPRPVTPSVYIELNPAQDPDEIDRFDLVIKGSFGERGVSIMEFNKWVTAYGLRIPPESEQWIYIYPMKEDGAVHARASVTFSYRKGML